MRLDSYAVLTAMTLALATSVRAQEIIANTGGTIYPVSGPKITNDKIVQLH